MQIRKQTPARLALALAAALTFVAPPVASLAQPEIPARGPMIASIDKPPAESESALGGFAAIGCGFFIRATIATGGLAAGTWAGAIACCAYMLLDGLVFDHK
ncbi:MAG: hypothetical protein A2W00_10175 [Candidatus Eisenbacteria bacterium RBG_16_71_46]|nr:MAG: hypothetical protein A2W00_10175 [Candidatus Eisenbacteria bacterium RBG_16_71_46]